MSMFYRFFYSAAVRVAGLNAVANIVTGVVRKNLSELDFNEVLSKVDATEGEEVTDLEFANGLLDGIFEELTEQGFPLVLSQEVHRRVHPDVVDLVLEARSSLA